MNLVVLPLTPDRWEDLEAIFNARGCSVARGCWCMYYRVSGREQSSPTDDARSSGYRESLRKLAEKNPPPGLLGYSGDTPVGWISLGPREDFTRLARSPVMKPVDDRSVWSIVCFVVPSGYRRQGAARELLAGAITYAKERGVGILEAYPTDRDTPGGPTWFGSARMYREAGFVEVARRKSDRPVMRLYLGQR